MLQALLRGKLSREHENMEDVLTSNVFGLLAYLPPEQGLIPFLKGATDPRGCVNPLCELSAVTEACYKFWPWLPESECIGCEPDVLIRLEDAADKRWLVLIEAKFHSGKSSQAEGDTGKPYDQLAREWDNLISLAARERRSPVLIYLTKDHGCPKDEIERSRVDFTTTRPQSDQPFTCFWLSWRHLASLTDRGGHPILTDLGQLLRRLDLTPFTGIRPIEHRPSYRFRRLRPGFHWNINASPNWRYTEAPT